MIKPSDILDDAKTIVGDCLPGCNEVRYQMSETIFPNLYDFYEGKIVPLIVLFESDSVVKYVRDEVYTIEDIIGMLLPFKCSKFTSKA